MQWTLLQFYYRLHRTLNYVINIFLLHMNFNDGWKEFAFYNQIILTILILQCTEKLLNSIPNSTVIQVYSYSSQHVLRKVFHSKVSNYCNAKVVYLVIYSFFVTNLALNIWRRVRWISIGLFLLSIVGALAELRRFGKEKPEGMFN